MKYSAPALLFCLSLLGLALSGCSQNSNKSVDSAPPAASDAHSNHGGDDDVQHLEGSQTDMEKMKAQLAKMSPEDASSAERQHFCPVSGKMLGSMGLPKKVDVNGQQVWICCDGCKDKLLNNPDEYLAKLRKE